MLGDAIASKNEKILEKLRDQKLTIQTTVLRGLKLCAWAKGCQDCGLDNINDMGRLSFLKHKDGSVQLLARSAYRGGSSAQNERMRTMRERPREMEASRPPHSDPGHEDEICLG